MRVASAARLEVDRSSASTLHSLTKVEPRKSTDGSTNIAIELVLEHTRSDAARARRRRGPGPRRVSPPGSGLPPGDRGGEITDKAGDTLPSTHTTHRSTESYGGRVRTISKRTSRTYPYPGSTSIVCTCVRHPPSCPYHIDKVSRISGLGPGHHATKDWSVIKYTVSACGNDVRPGGGRGRRQRERERSERASERELRGEVGCLDPRGVLDSRAVHQY